AHAAVPRWARSADGNGVGAAAVARPRGLKELQLTRAGTRRRSSHAARVRLLELPLLEKGLTQSHPARTGFGMQAKDTPESDPSVLYATRLPEKLTKAQDGGEMIGVFFEQLDEHGGCGGQPPGPS